MASGNPTRKSLKPLMFCALAGLVLLAMLVWSYWGLSVDAIQKTQPYTVQIELETNEAATVSVDYDYGYGFNDGHQRKLQLRADEGLQQVTFSISAWKNIQALRFNDFDSGVELRSFVIEKGGRRYQSKLDQLKGMSAGGQLVINEISAKLEQAQ